MHKTIEKLMEGDPAVPQYFATAKSKWEELLSDISSVSAQELTERLTTAQLWFEQHCGGRWDGQEVMVWSGFASL